MITSARPKDTWYLRSSWNLEILISFDSINPDREEKSLFGVQLIYLVEAGKFETV
jgi:hypothetical protein